MAKKLKGGPFGEICFGKIVSQSRKVPFGPVEFLR